MILAELNYYCNSQYKAATLVAYRRHRPVDQVVIFCNCPITAGAATTVKVSKTAGKVRPNSRLFGRRATTVLFEMCCYYRTKFEDLKWFFLVATPATTTIALKVWTTAQGPCRQSWAWPICRTGLQWVDFSRKPSPSPNGARQKMASRIRSAGDCSVATLTNVRMP